MSKEEIVAPSLSSDFLRRLSDSDSGMVTKVSLTDGKTVIVRLNLSPLRAAVEQRALLRASRAAPLPPHVEFDPDDGSLYDTVTNRPYEHPTLESLLLKTQSIDLRERILEKDETLRDYKSRTGETRLFKAGEKYHEPVTQDVRVVYGTESSIHESGLDLLESSIFCSTPVSSLETRTLSQQLAAPSALVQDLYQVFGLPIVLSEVSGSLFPVTATSGQTPLELLRQSRLSDRVLVLLAVSPATQNNSGVGVGWTRIVRGRDEFPLSHASANARSGGELFFDPAIEPYERLVGARELTQGRVVEAASRLKKRALADGAEMLVLLDPLNELNESSEDQDFLAELASSVVEDRVVSMGGREIRVRGVPLPHAGARVCALFLLSPLVSLPYLRYLAQRQPDPLQIVSESRARRRSNARGECTVLTLSPSRMFRLAPSQEAMEYLRTLHPGRFRMKTSVVPGEGAEFAVHVRPVSGEPLTSGSREIASSRLGYGYTAGPGRYYLTKPPEQRDEGLRFTFSAVATEGGIEEFPSV